MREFHRAPRGYELMILINPEITDEALTATIDAVSGYVTAPGAEITYIKRDTPWGRRRLAYPIQRFRDATYILFQFLASPSDLTEIERELKLDERVIRYLLVRQEHLHVEEEEEGAEGQGEQGSSGESAQEAEADDDSDDSAEEAEEAEESSDDDDDAGNADDDTSSEVEDASSEDDEPKESE